MSVHWSVPPIHRHILNVIISWSFISWSFISWSLLSVALTVLKMLRASLQMYPHGLHLSAFSILHPNSVSTLRRHSFRYFNHFVRYYSQRPYHSSHHKSFISSFGSSIHSVLHFQSSVLWYSSYDVDISRVMIHTATITQNSYGSVINWIEEL